MAHTDSRRNSLELPESDDRVAEFYRRKSFSREFPDIPVLQFDSVGDPIDASARKLRIRACSWNIAGAPPVDKFDELLGVSASAASSTGSSSQSSSDQIDLFALGFQELSANPLAPVLQTVVMSEMWTAKLKESLAPQRYMLVQSIRLQGLLLLVFCKDDIVHSLRNVQSSFLRLGASGWWGNKGAVGISLKILGTSICFLNCHLCAHEHAFEERVQNHRQILSDLVFPAGEEATTILEHDYTVWMGDFNFRIQGISQDKTLFYIETKQWAKLLKHDQLHRAAFVKGAFSTFREGKIHHPPTYKFVMGTDQYETRDPKNIRRPSYCDRILWRTGFGDEHRASLIEYTSCQKYQISDHKPVVLTLDVQLVPEEDHFVTFDPIDRWFVGDHGFFRYIVDPSYAFSKWDWIGLFKIPYASFKDYCTYVWAPGGASSDNLGCINGRYVVKSGLHRLIYFSAERKCGVGYSDPFMIEEPRNVSQ